MRKRTLTSYIVGCLLCAPSWAFITGEKLNQLIQTPQGTEAAKGYVYGVMDTFALGENSKYSTPDGPKEFKKYCPPSEVTREEAFDVVSESLRTSWMVSLPAPVLISTALSIKWPCGNHMRSSAP